MLDPGPRTIDCDVGSLPADLATVADLARLQLNARRLGFELRICGCSCDLEGLLCFVGLDEVLGLEPRREAEEREERLRVEEERQLGNSAA